MEDKKKYSKWEFEEEEQVIDPNADPDNTPNPEEEEKPQEEEQVSDDTPMKVMVDGKEETVTLGEMRDGYMRQSDYTKKSQEVANAKKEMDGMTPEQQQQTVDVAEKVAENPNDYPEEDVKAAQYLIDIAKDKFGLMTKDEYQEAESRKSQMSEFSGKIDATIKKVSEMKGMPEFNEEEIIEHMKETGNHDPLSAYLSKYDTQYRDHIIKQSKGDSSYKSDKGGKKVEPKEKVVDVSTPDGHRSFLSDELNKIKNS